MLFFSILGNLSEDVDMNYSNTVTLSEQAYGILTDAAEDCTGLWGAVWTLMGFARNVPMGESDEKPNQSPEYETYVPQAQLILKKLIDLNWIELYRGIAWPPSALTEVRVQQDEIANIFSRVLYWEVPTGNTSGYICFAATESGKQIWRQGKQSFIGNQVFTA